MAKRKVPGYGKSKGKQSDVPVFPEGKYVFQVESHDEKEAANGLGLTHTYRLRCIDTLGSAAEQGEMVDKPYFLRIYEMYPDHPQFEAYGHIGVDELKSLFIATGADSEVKGDTVDFDLPINKTFVGTVKQRDGKDAEGNPRKENEIRKYEVDEG